jgi:uncharacterized damage-inducible protein DinB
MNKAEIDLIWAHLNGVLRNLRQQIERIPEDKLDFRPAPEMRTIGELCAHPISYLLEAPNSVVAQKYVENPAPAFSKKTDLLAWMDVQVKECNRIVASLTDAQLATTITAYNMQFPAWQLLSAVMDETLHHRGQVTVYLRLMGIEPAFIYDLE